MISQPLSAPLDANIEIAAIIETLHKNEQRLKELTAGEVDAVSDSQGRTFLLRHAQEQLRLNEAARQTAILNALPAHIALLDTRGVIVTVNESWRRFAATNVLHGPGHAVGVNYLEICDITKNECSTEARQVAEGIRAALQSETKSFSIEYPYHSPTEERWFLLTVTPLGDDCPNGAVVMHLDITERKQTENALRESDEKFHQLADNINDVFWIASPDLKTMHYISPGYERIWGRPKEDLSANPHQWIDAILPADQDRVISVFSELRETKPDVSVEYQIARPDGTVRWVHDRGFQVRDVAGRVIRLAGIVSDITERKQAERVSMRLAAIVDSSDDAIIGKDLNGIVTSWNSGAEKIFGYTAAEMVGTSILRLIPSQQQPEEDQILKKIRNVEMVEHFETKRKTRDGRLIDVSITISPIKDAAGIVVGASKVAHDITGRKITEEALRTREAEFRTLAEAIPQIVWITRPDGENIYFNQQWMDYTGLSLVESLGCGWSKPFHPDDQQRARDTWIHATSSKGVYKLESRLRRADGVYRWWLIRGVPHLDAVGKVLKWFGTCTDIHDLKSAELEISNANRSLRESALVLATAQRIAHFGSWELTTSNLDDVDSNPLQWSDEMFRIAGYEPGVVKISNEFFFSCVPTDEHEKIRQGLAIAIRDRQQFSVVHRLIRPSGEERIVHEMAEISFDEKTGRPLKIVGTAHDITERKKAETLLYRQQSELRVLFDLMPALIWFKDTKNRILRVNQRAAEMAGKTTSEIEGKSMSEVYPREAAKYYADDLEVITSNAPKLAIVETLREPNGDEIWVQTDKVPVHDGDGKVMGIVVMAQDITARKRAEEALRKSEVQLRQSQKMDAIGQLAGGVAHDFNNLLTVILGRAELLQQRSDLPEPVSRSIKLIHQTGTRAAVLTRQLLQFSRQQVLQPKVLDFNVLIPNMQEMLRRLISEDIDLVLKLSTTAGNIEADPGQIEQVVMNLVINARDAMPKGGTVWIETKDVDLDAKYCEENGGAAAGPHLMLAVGDTGCGMAEEIRARIFEPFFTTKEQGRGTGLGLSTVYGIVKQAGGSIYVYSEVNQGTIFKVYFPKVFDKSAPKISSAALPAVKGGGETILLVEDEEGIRDLLNEILTDKGYRVLLARDGEHAVQYSNNFTGNIQLLLTDVVMPKMNGKEAASKILKSRGGMKVMFMSGYTDDSIVSRGVLEAGIEFLEKPFTPASVAKRVREVLDNVTG